MQEAKTIVRHRKQIVRGHNLQMQCFQWQQIMWLQKFIKIFLRKNAEVSKNWLYLCNDNYRSIVIAFLPDAADSGFYSSQLVTGSPGFVDGLYTIRLQQHLSPGLGKKLTTDQKRYFTEHCLHQQTPLVQTSKFNYKTAASWKYKNSKK